MDVSPQLAFGGLLRTSNQSLGGAPEQPSSYAENNSEQSDNGFAVLMEPLAATPPDSFVETADVFLKGAVGCVLLMLLYAGLERW